MTSLSSQKILDLYFIENRHRLLDIAAFLDRLDRAQDEGDFRKNAFIEALLALNHAPPKQRTLTLLEHFSDTSLTPAAKAPYQGACGASPQ